MQCRSRAREAFTLTEVAFSLAILVVAILSVMLLVAAGLRSQQQVRYQAYAAAKAVQVLDAFSQPRQSFDGGQIPTLDYSSDSNVGRQLVRATVFNAAGQFDLEKIVGNNLEGVYPVPPEIARRLDATSDEIRRVLDAGGQLYYFDPYAMTGFDRQYAKSGAEKAAVPELQNLVFAVIGAPQQNTLPVHPLMRPQRRLYPFPPMAAYRPGPRRWVLSNPNYAGAGNLRGDLVTADGTAVNVSDGAYPDGNNWEWGAYRDETRGLSANASGTRWTASSAWSPWRVGIAEFRRLSAYHWWRIQQQLSLTRGTSSAGTRLDPIYETRTRTITQRQIVYDRLRNATFVDVPTTVTERIVVGYKSVASSSGSDQRFRGIPSPPLGLPKAHGLRGTDVLYEDHETAAGKDEGGNDRLSQLRFGLPGLERRVMYRTAALALWAKVDGHAPLMSASPDVLGQASDPLAGDPNVADNIANLLATRNPLERVVSPPPNARDIHPAQVLALSYLAHAALMVTGYKPPFVDERGSQDPSDDENIVPESLMSQPYKALTGERYYLMDPAYDENGDGTPDCEDLSKAPLKVSGFVGDPAKDPRLARDMAGNPIVYRRYTGPIINPYPPPYADRGAFGMDGQRHCTWDEPDPDSDLAATQRRTMASHGDPALAGKDTLWARNALETALRWAMAYVSEHTYDHIVPKPVNRMSFVDRPLFSFDLFDSAGQARRPPVGAIDSAFYPVIWPGDGARFGAGSEPYAVWRATSPKHYRDRYSAWPRVGDAANPTRPTTTVPRKNSDKPTLYLDFLSLGKPFGEATGGYRRGFSTDLGGIGNVDDPIITLLGRLGNLHDQRAGAGQTYVTNPPEGRSPRGDRFWQSKPFAVADRCRQLVFWAVNWKSYEDAESAPSAPIDRSLLGLKPDNYNSKWVPAGRMDGQGNPERWLCWANPARDGTLGKPPASSNIAYGADWDGRFDNRIEFRNLRYWNGSNQDSAAVDIPWSALGIWGADRNGNGLWDRGPTPANVRLRAVEVARFVYYDPVAWTGLRN